MMSQVDLDAIEQEVRLCFIQEDAPEHIATLERGILLLNQAGGRLPTDEFPQEWNAMMRSAHTLKGGAALSQLQELSQLAHLVEDLLQALGDRRVIQPDLACQLLMCSIDDIRALLTQATNGQSNPQSSVLDDFKTFIATGLNSSSHDTRTKAENVTEEQFLVRTVFEGDFKNCLERGKAQIDDAVNDTQILQFLTEVVQECGVLAEVLNLEQLHQQIQKITGALVRTPANPARFAKRILNYLEQERQKVLNQIHEQSSDDISSAPGGEDLEGRSPLSSLEADGISENSESTAELQGTDMSHSLTNGSSSIQSAAPSLKPEVSRQTSADVTIPPPDFAEPHQPRTGSDHIMSFEAGGVLSAPSSSTTAPAYPDVRTVAQVQDTTERSSTRVAPSAELTMRVPVRRLDQLASTVGEMLITYERLTLDQRRLQHTNRDLKQRTRQFYTIRERIQSLYDQLLVPGWNQTLDIAGNSEFDPLEMDQFTDLHSVLQDFQELLARIEEGSQDIDVLTQANLDDAEQLRQQMGELRHSLTDARMVPFATLSNRFRRPLWDLNQRYEKSVQLSIDGESTPIDRAVLEHLYEPMLHLVRNAFDHGIETPTERAAKGKGTAAYIRLAASHQGTKVVITVEDDGRGIDFEKVQRRAEHMGLLSGENVTTQQLLQCLFAPGFSTTTQVSELSGRGVGLDVVKAQVENLRGAIQVNSSPGQGTQFKLTIPLTLNIMPLLVCQRLLPQGNPITLAIPSSHISEIVDTPRYREDDKIMHWRGQDIPYVLLEKLMPFGEQYAVGQLNHQRQVSAKVSSEPNIAVILSLSHQPIAIGVNQLLGEQEMVLKTFDDLVTVPLYFPGCTVLPSGQVVLVLAPDPLEGLFQGRELALVEQQAQSVLGMDDTQRAIASLTPQSTTSESITSVPDALPLTTPQSALASGTHHGPDTVPIPTPPSDLGRSAHSTQSPRTIMVVDDSVAARRWMVRSLERSGYQVLQCRDGQDALDSLNKGAQCHLVICDIEMPRLNGFQLLSEIRQTQTLKSLPFALLTSRQGDRHRKQATQLGANGYFVKPLGGQQLLRKIENLMNANSA